MAEGAVSLGSHFVLYAPFLWPLLIRTGVDSSVLWPVVAAWFSLLGNAELGQRLDGGHSILNLILKSLANSGCSKHHNTQKFSVRFNYGGTKKLWGSRESQSAERGRRRDPACGKRERQEATGSTRDQASHLSLLLLRKAVLWGELDLWNQTEWVQIPPLTLTDGTLNELLQSYPVPLFSHLKQGDHNRTHFIGFFVKIKWADISSKCSKMLAIISIN